MIPGVKDALIFIMLDDLTVHQVDLSKARTLDVLKRFGDQVKLCEQAEPLTWERPEDQPKSPNDDKPGAKSGTGSRSSVPLLQEIIQEESRGSNPPPELSEVLKAKLITDGEKLVQSTKYLDTKTGLLKLYGDE